MQETEILLIGGGIAGTSTAYYLTQYGHEVTLLERGEIAGEASGLNAGTLWATGWGTRPTLASTLSMGSLDILKTLQIDLGQYVEFRQSGSFKVISTEEELAFVREVVPDLTAGGHQVELLSPRDALSLEPGLSPNILGCLYYPYGGNANPVKTTGTFAALAEQRGAIILTRHEVTGIRYLDDGSYEVDTLPGVFKAKILVLAAGPWCRSLGSMLGLEIPVYAVRGQMWSTGPVPPRIFHSVGAVESALYWHKAPFSDENTPLELTHRGGQRLTRHLYGQQTQDGEIIFGGARQVDVAKVPDPVGIEVNREHAIEVFPFLREFPIKRTWAGWMPFTRNLQPIIGKVPWIENVYVLTGLGSSGFEQGPMAGKLLADWIHEGRGASVPGSAG